MGVVMTWIFFSSTSFPFFLHFCLLEMNTTLNPLVHLGMLLLALTIRVGPNGSPPFSMGIKSHVVEVFEMMLQNNLLLPWTHITQKTQPFIPKFLPLFSMSPFLAIKYLDTITKKYEGN
jgi:hypothetical protein